MLTVKGTFSKINGTIDLNEKSLSNSKIDLAISVQGLDTNNKKRNEHLQQDDFFKASKFPEITFSSTNIEKKHEFYWAKGSLNVAGTQKTVDIPFILKDNHVTGKLSLNRMDFNVGKVPPFVAAKMVDVTFALEVK